MRTRMNTTHTGRNNDKASLLGWLTWILIVSVKYQCLSVVVMRGKIWNTEVKTN